MCGDWGASRCSPIKWFTFMGDASNPYVPFQITYKHYPNATKVDAYTPLDSRVVPCSEKLDVSIFFLLF